MATASPSHFKPSYLINYHKNLVSHYNLQSICTLFRKEITFPFSPVIISIQERQYNRGKKHYTDYMVSTYGRTRSGRMHAFTEDEHGSRQMAGFSTKNEQFLTIKLKGNVNHYLYGDYYITVYVKITFSGFDDSNTVRYFFEPGLELAELNCVHVDTIEGPSSESEEVRSQGSAEDGQPLLEDVHQPLFIRTNYRMMDPDSEEDEA